MGSHKQTTQAVKTVFHFGSPYRRFQFPGAAPTLAVVGPGLTLPWILRGFAEIVSPRGSDHELGRVIFNVTVAEWKPRVKPLERAHRLQNRKPLVIERGARDPVDEESRT